MTLSMVISAFNYAMQDPIIQRDELLEFATHSGRLIICCLHNEFHFSLTTQVPEYYMTFNVDLYLNQHKSNFGSVPDEQDSSSYYPQSDDHLVPPGVPFEFPCPCCACFLKQEQVVNFNVSCLILL